MFGRQKKSELSLNFERSPIWEVDATEDAGKYLRSLRQLEISDVVAYFEGTTEREIEHFLELHKAANPEPIAVGTIWPIPTKYHMPLDSDLLAELAQLVDHLKSYFCTHTHIYVPGRVILQWHDAFGTDAMYLGAIAENRVAEFASAIGVSYRREK
jgi:hypothetical protein